MKLNNQVCSLEQAKRLNELGITQETFFCYAGGINDTVPPQLLTTDYVYSECAGWAYNERIAAFTVAELGAMLPEWTANDTLRLEQWATERQEKRAIQYRKNPGEFHPTDTPENAIFRRTEAAARADMLIYLLEHKYVTPEEVNARLLNS
jgi:hypothetical protein